MASASEQDSAPVVVALAVTSQPMTRDELVVAQLEESELIDVHDTQKSVTVDSEHDVGEGVGSGEGSGSGSNPPSRGLVKLVVSSKFCANMLVPNGREAKVATQMVASFTTHEPVISGAITTVAPR